jgi:hypothetical protein
LFAGMANSAPRESTSVNGPSMTSGPFGRMRIVTGEDMGNLRMLLSK